MILLSWKDQCRTGISPTDPDHRDLMDLINRSYARLAVAGNRETIGALFDDVYRCISAHFVLEEWFMHAHGYDHLTAHKSDHERLLDEVCDIMSEFEIGEAAVDGFGAQLSAWLSTHLQTHDARFHKALLANH